MTENSQTFSIYNCRVSHEIKAGVGFPTYPPNPKRLPDRLRQAKQDGEKR
jgi:hypothetical protein